MQDGINVTRLLYAFLSIFLVLSSGQNDLLFSAVNQHLTVAACDYRVASAPQEDEVTPPPEIGRAHV